ncbi:hypothetical protein DFH07DRAFT_772103 [Mycena maculata]|uniref:Uncharacterized protein n=1 Tax=Mycena maculata TaxID=230809 RepID=A0AAD7JAS3_9AGAR|nr:hypothetical protein DFH07DRAFT_772103 [Mycena maculata]
MSNTVTTSGPEDAGPSNTSNTFTIFPRHTVLTSTPAVPGSGPGPSTPPIRNSQSPSNIDPDQDERSTWIKVQDDEPTFIINADQSLSFPALVGLSNPILPENVSSFAWHQESIIFQVPTVMPEHRTSNNFDVRKRRATAILIGARTLQKTFLLEAKHAPRRLHEKVFKREFEQLNELLTHIDKSRTTTNITIDVYRIRSENYYALINMLTYRLGQAISSFKDAGKDSPELPSWADEEDSGIEDWSNINDFEIIAVCFRLEVENFLTVLDKRYNFNSGHPRPTVQMVQDQDDAETSAIRLPSQQNQRVITEKGNQAFMRDVPPHMDTSRNLQTLGPSAYQEKGKGREVIGDYDAIRKSQSAMYHHPDSSIRASALLAGSSLPASNKRLSNYSSQCTLSLRMK